MVPKLCEKILEKKSSWMISKRPVLPYTDYRDRVKEIDPIVSDELVQISSNYIQDMGEVCLYKNLYDLQYGKHYHYISCIFQLTAEGDQGGSGQATYTACPNKNLTMFARKI